MFLWSSQWYHSQSLCYFKAKQLQLLTIVINLSTAIWFFAVFCQHHYTWPHSKKHGKFQAIFFYNNTLGFGYRQSGSCQSYSKRRVIRERKEYLLSRYTRNKEFFYIWVASISCRNKLQLQTCSCKQLHIDIHIYSVYTYTYIWYRYLRLRDW